MKREGCTSYEDTQRGDRIELIDFSDLWTPDLKPGAQGTVVSRDDKPTLGKRILVYFDNGAELWLLDDSDCWHVIFRPNPPEHNQDTNHVPRRRSRSK